LIKEGRKPVVFPRGNWLGILIPAAIAICSIFSAITLAGVQAEPLPDLVPSERLNLEEFEPSVRDQIGKAYEEARSMLQDGTAVGRLGMMFQVYGKYELAETCYARARGLDPGSPRWPYYLAIVEKSLGRNEQAIAHVREALKIDGSYSPARIRLAQLLLDAGDAGQSEAICRSVIAQNNNLATAHFTLGQALAAKRDWPAAIESYRRACEIAGNFAAAHYALGMAYRNTGDMAKARELLERSQALKQLKQPSEDPLMDDVNSLYSGGLTRFAKGSSFYQQGKLAEAIQEFEAALEVNPRLVTAHVNLIALFGQLNQPDKAEQHFRAAVELDPGWVEAYYNWGFFLAQHGRKTEAAELFRKAVEVNPDYPEARVQLGLLLDEIGRSGEASVHYQRALQVDPDNRQAHYFLGRSLLRSGQVKEAIQHLLETTKVEDVWTPVCMQAVAIAYEHGGDREQAIHFLREAQKRALTFRQKDLASQLQRDIDRLASEARRP
jgi:tetratricopeptide (TPR) repeat protein